MYVLGARMNCSASSSTGSGEGFRGSGSVVSSSGIRSRSPTSWNAGRVASIAGVIMSGSVGSILDIDSRIALDCRGGEAGGEAAPGEDRGDVLNWRCISKRLWNVGYGRVLLSYGSLRRPSYPFPQRWIQVVPVRLQADFPSSARRHRPCTTHPHSHS